MRGSRILIVSKNREKTQEHADLLESRGCFCQVKNNAKAALETIDKGKYDLILIDQDLEGEIDGIDMCRRIRQRREGEDYLISIFTQRTDNTTKKAGFEAGADDYITFCQDHDLLLLKIRALLRRTSKEKQESEVIFRDLRLNKFYQRVYFKGKEVEMPKKEFELLWLLIEKEGRILTKEEMIEKIWQGQEPEQGSRTLDSHIAKLRRKIDKSYIKTERGRGIRLVRVENL